jgi:putative transposase
MRVFKTALIEGENTWVRRAQVGRETAAWVRWCNTTGLHSSIGYIPPCSSNSPTVTARTPP